MHNFQVHQKFKQIKNNKQTNNWSLGGNMGAEEGFLGLNLGATKANWCFSLLERLLHG